MFLYIVIRIVSSLQTLVNKWTEFLKWIRSVPVEPRVIKYNQNVLSGYIYTLEPLFLEYLLEDSYETDYDYHDIKEFNHIKRKYMKLFGYIVGLPFYKDERVFQSESNNNQKRLLITEFEGLQVPQLYDYKLVPLVPVYRKSFLIPFITSSFFPWKSLKKANSRDIAHTIYSLRLGIPRETIYLLEKWNLDFEYHVHDSTFWIRPITSESVYDIAIDLTSKDRDILLRLSSKQDIRKFIRDPINGTFVPEWYIENLSSRITRTLSCF